MLSPEMDTEKRFWAPSLLFLVYCSVRQSEVMQYVSRAATLGWCRHLVTFAWLPYLDQWCA